MLPKINRGTMLWLWLLLLMITLECIRCQGGADGQQPKIVIGISDINAAGEAALKEIQVIDRLEKELVRQGLVLEKCTAASFHQSLFRGNPQELSETGRNGLIEIETALQLVKKLDLNLESRKQIETVQLGNTIIADACPKPPRCLETRYRSIDGSCNNKDNLSWGKSFTPLMRLQEPVYDDGINTPRTVGFARRRLPSPRLVSSRVSPDVNAPSSRVSLHFMQWGQFLDHDITNTALTEAREGRGITCCSEEVQRNRSLLHPACFPIDIPEDDRFYSSFSSRCMEFVRSAPAPGEGCTLGARQQLNILTSFIDGSMIYGSTFNESLNLRSFEGGKLRSSTRAGEDVLPPDESAACISTNDQTPCFVAGDNRVNEQTLLTLYHQIWFREHNRIAGSLSQYNPGWKDEALYQETRRIVGAMIQHVTYNEFLPILLGQRVMGQYQLNVQWSGFNCDYDENVNPSISNVFATAAFRMGHTLVGGLLRLISETNEPRDNGLWLSTQFFNPVVLYDEGAVDSLLRGMSSTPSQAFDNYVTDQLTEHLFQPPGLEFGLDLVSLNIQRGRDHGLPGYNHWREFCKLPKADEFEQLASFIKPSVADTFSQLYGTVDDVDLFIAGISETPVERDAVLPPTFGCLVAEQFRRLKTGDRFWYENGDMESSFREGQLNEIRKVTLARVLCDNSNIQSIPRNAFLLESRRNPREGCIQGKIPRMNLELWKNEPIWE